VNWIVSADITGLFDNIDKRLLKGIIQKRVNDGGVQRLIGKWLHAGVMEGEKTTYPDRGTPQGGVISPMPSNIFLHEVLDEWYVSEVKPRMQGRSFLIRWADDFIMGFECETDVRRVMEVLPKRFERYKLELHPEKTALIPFGRPRNDTEGRPRGTFDFLGFTFHWGQSGQGYWVIKKKTARRRLSRFMKQQGQGAVRKSTQRLPAASNCPQSLICQGGTVMRQAGCRLPGSCPQKGADSAQSIHVQALEI
jgi:hypothetical protein